MRKTLVRIIRELKLLSFHEKISFSLKLFFYHFYGQSFIKTVRGPLTSSERNERGKFFGNYIA